MGSLTRGALSGARVGRGGGARGSEGPCFHETAGNPVFGACKEFASEQTLLGGFVSEDLDMKGQSWLV